ncbi:MAG: class A beta-lactamase-related serine hydrolase [Candidatus Eremiobacteraeota bacterium]|nr:class A beta-lactamase-related serine hydrolase [Candidatus Eremiobacteraeota bacterium]
MTVDLARPGHDRAIDAYLAAALERAALEHPGVVSAASAYLCDLESQRDGHWRGDANIYPASVIKVPIMAEAFHQYALGTLRPHDQVVVAEGNQTSTSGPAPFHAGYVATVEELVDLMITYSDNVATNQLMDVLRREQVTNYMHELGLQTFHLGRKLSGSEPLIVDPEQVGRNRLPAQEIGWLLLLIANDSIAGSAEQREILRRCAHNDKLVPGLRRGDVFMHKTGETSDLSHDAGILVTAQGKRSIVVLFCEVVPTPDEADAMHANPFMLSWMRAIREHL